MKITDMIISAIIKKGILGEARNFEADFDIPTEPLHQTKEEGIQFKKITVHVKVEHMSIRIEKEEAGA